MKKLLIIILVILGSMVACTAIVVAGTSGQHDTVDAVSEKSATPPPAPSADSHDVEDGVYLVTEDIPAGRYRAMTNVDGDCYWEITDQKTGDIVKNDMVQGGRPTVTLKKGQQFKSQGCGKWSKS